MGSPEETVVTRPEPQNMAALEAYAAAYAKVPKLLPADVQQREWAALGGAWWRCEAALPARFSLDLTTNGRGTYGALARPPFMDYGAWMDAKREEWAATPTAALTALAERLEALNAAG
jgi:hypothetical protein